jgi:hypothetical protein
MGERTGLRGQVEIPHTALRHVAPAAVSIADGTGGGGGGGGGGVERVAMVTRVLDDGQEAVDGRLVLRRDDRGAVADRGRFGARHAWRRDKGVKVKVEIKVTAST